MKQIELAISVEPHYIHVLNTHVFEYTYIKVPSILIPKTQICHKVDKILKFAITRNANTPDNHEDFHKVVMGPRVKVR